jgi:hypothetical protein
VEKRTDLQTALLIDIVLTYSNRYEIGVSIRALRSIRLPPELAVSISIQPVERRMNVRGRSDSSVAAEAENIPVAEWLLPTYFVEKLEPNAAQK